MSAEVMAPTAPWPGGPIIQIAGSPPRRFVPLLAARGRFAARGAGAAAGIPRLAQGLGLGTPDGEVVHDPRKGGIGQSSRRNPCDPKHATFIDQRLEPAHPRLRHPLPPTSPPPA